MRTYSSLLQKRLLRLMNGIAEAHRRGQADVAETMTITAAGTLMKLVDARRSEGKTNRSVHALFMHSRSDK
jgi:hypothetical protein